MLANRVRMGISKSLSPLYLFQSGTDSYLDWNVFSGIWEDPDSSYANSDFIQLVGVPIMDWYGQATYSPPINKGKRNLLEVTFSHGQPGPPFSEPETILLDISGLPGRINFNLLWGDLIRMEGVGSYGYFEYSLGLEVPPGEALGIRFYSICLKQEVEFGEPILAVPGIFLDKWTASSTGMGVAQVYDNMLYLSFHNYAGVGNSATFLSDPVKVSSDALDWRVNLWNSVGGTVMGYVLGGPSHGIPIGTIVKIGITFTCTQQEMQPFMSARFELTLSIIDEDGELLVSWPITDTQIEQQAVSIEWLKFD